MKVVLLSHVFGQDLGGGATAAVMHLAKGLLALGIDVSVIATHSGPASKSILADGMVVHRLPHRNLYWVEEKDTHSVATKVIWQLVDTWNPAMLGQLRSALTEEAPDIVHVHKLRGLSPAVWSAAGNVSPLFQSCHDYEVMSPEGTLRGRLGEMARDQVWVLRPYQRMRASMSNRVDVVTAPSRYTLNTIIAAGFFASARQAVVPNSHGMTTAQLRDVRASHSHNHADAPMRFLYLGRLETTKGINVLVDAFTRVARERPEAELHIAGFGSLEVELRSWSESSQGVQFHGAVFGEAKQQLIRSCDVVLVPSVWPEVFGIVVVEAYAQGKPVIASRIGGLPELIREGETGFLVLPDDASALSETMIRLIDEPAPVRSMYEACFEEAERFTIEDVTRLYLELYQDALAAGSTATVSRSTESAG